MLQPLGRNERVSNHLTAADFVPQSGHLAFTGSGPANSGTRTPPKATDPLTHHWPHRRHRLTAVVVEPAGRMWRLTMVASVSGSDHRGAPLTRRA